MVRTLLQVLALRPDDRLGLGCKHLAEREHPHLLNEGEQPFLMASDAIIIGSPSCCSAIDTTSGTSACFPPFSAALFFMAAPWS